MDDIITVPQVRGMAVAPPAGRFANLAADKTVEDSLKRSGYWELHKLATADSHIVTQTMDAADIGQFPAQRDFDLDIDDVMEDVRGNHLPLEYAEELLEAQSPEEYQARLNLYTRKLSDASYIARHGWKGFAANITATLSDPVGLAVDAVASVAAGAGVANRGRKLLQAAGAAGAANAVIGAGQSQVDPAYDAGTLLSDFAMGAGLGAAFDIGGSLLNQAERMELANGLSKFGDRVKGGTFGPDSGGAARVKGSRVETGLDVDYSNRRGGEMAEELREAAEQNADIDTWNGSMRRKLFGGSLSTRVRTSTNDVIREIGRRLMPDDVRQIRRNADGIGEDVTNAPAATDFAWTQRSRLYTEFRTEHEAAMKEWFTAQGRGNLRRMFDANARGEFNRSVVAALRGADPASPAVARAASAARRTLDNSWDSMAQHGVKGVTRAGKVEGYVPRLKRNDLHAFLRVKMGSQTGVDDTLSTLIGNAIRSERVNRGLDVDDTMTRNVSRAYTKWLLHAEDESLKRSVTSNDLDFFDEVLQGAGLGDAEIDAALRYLNNEDPNVGLDSKPSARLKQRLTMNELETIRLDNGDTLSLADLFESDVEKLLERYTWHTSGLSGLAEAGFKDWKELDATLGGIAADPSYASDVEAARMAMKHVLGHPLEADANGAWGKAARTLGGLNFVTTMGQVFWSMMAENGAILGLAGLRASIKQFPAMRSIVKQMKDGTMGDDLARELAVLGNPGATLVRSSVSTRSDSSGLAGMDGRLSQRADNALHAAQRGVALVGGLLPIQDMQQVYLSRAFAQRLFDWAQAGGIPTSKASGNWRSRLMDYGLSPQDQSALMRHLKAHARADKSGVLESVGLAQMEPGLARNVEVAMHRMIRHGVQEGDIGASFGWMHSNTMKLVTQFRGFSLTALNRRSLHSLSRMDATSGLMLMYGMTFGGAAVAARTYLNYPEGHPMRERMANPAHLAKSAFAATGESSLIPMMVDTMFHYAGSDPFFTNANRSTGLGSDLVSGIPTIATLNKVGDAIGIPGSAIRTDREVSESDMRSAAGLIPFNNVIGINRFNRWLASQFPNDREVAERRRMTDLLTE